MDADEEREALRRRLYRPGASEEDRRRYVGTLDVGDTAAEPAAEAPTAPRHRGAVVSAALVVVAVVVALLIGRAAVAPEATAAPPAPTARTILPSRQVAVSIDGTALLARRIEGTGDARILLEDVVAPRDGRLLVVLSSTDARPVGWTAGRSDATVVALRPVQDRDGSTRADVAPYRGVGPAWIRVEAPDDALWTITVAFDGGTDPTLR